jgi:hypothetical protein
VQRKSQLGIMQVKSRWQGTFSRNLISKKEIFPLGNLSFPQIGGDTNSQELSPDP